jgi:4-hydroxyphenylacetate 3-monooxygenase
MPKTGEQHLESLRDGREVYLLGRKVEDVTAHPAFRNAAATAAQLYDFQCAPENLEKMTFPSPDTGERVSRCWQLPSCYQELAARREALEAWAGTHFGFLGRSPDHVASCLSGMYMGREVFEAYDRKRAAALCEYYQYARDHDLFLTYLIINPQGDRSLPPHQQEDPFLAARLCDQDSQGIVVKGAKLLGTSAILANEALVTCIQPLKPGDEPYALTFASPLNAKGLRILARRSYEWAAGSVFDYPLSSRFDENDAVLYFDEVRVPWERVFVAGDIGMCQKQFHATPAHVYQNYQCQVRLVVKLRFLAGLAWKIAQANGLESFPQTRETLGSLAAEAALVEGLVSAMEVRGQPWGPYFVPDRHLLYAAQVLTQQLYPRVVAALRELAGAGLIMLPSGIEDLAEERLAAYALQPQRSPALSPEERVKFYKLAWDAIGSEFASRHTQYEMFYAGAGFVTKGHSYRTYDWEAATGLVDRLLASYNLQEELERAAAWRSKNSTGSSTP